MSDHPELLAFLRAIAAHPDDDTPRLVLADWLEEHGEGERASFIRVQCELTSLESGRWADGSVTKMVPYDIIKADGLRRRQWELFEHNRWLFPDLLDLVTIKLPGAPTDDLIIQRWIEVCRGLPSKLYCDWEWCSLHLDSILASPWVPGLDECELTSQPEWDEANQITDRVKRRFTSTVAGKLLTVPISVEAAEAYPMGLVAIHATARLLDARWGLVRKFTLPPEPRDPEPLPTMQEVQT